MRIHIDETPTAIEQGYLDQGYRLPEPYNWTNVHYYRNAWQHRDIDVPLVLVHGVVCGWGVPMTNDGKGYLKHE